MGRVTDQRKDEREGKDVSGREGKEDGRIEGKIDVVEVRQEKIYISLTREE